MAGDWIKMRMDLKAHPKVVRIASALKADRLRIIGGLYSAWCLFDNYSADGRMEGYTPEIFDEEIGLSGLAAAMISVGWLEQTSDGLVMPRFDAHNGQSAKRRAQDADRKREDRKIQNSSASEADKMRTREEKRREENKKKKQDSSTFVPPLWIDQQLWDDFIDMRKKIKKPATDRAKQLLINELQKLVEQGYSQQDVIGNSIRNGWQDFYAPKHNGSGGGKFVC